MNKRPGQIKVTIETGFCSFCDRTRNLRREERQLGALIRTVTSCESCHRVLNSTIGVAEPDAAAEAAAAPEATKSEPAATPVRNTRNAAVKPKAAAKPKTAATRSRPSK